jgi:hypothetical protein
MTLAVASVDASTTGGNDGSVDLTVAGGTQPFTFSWSNGAATEDISGLIADTYCVVVTDNGGCADSICAVVDEPISISCDRPNTLVGTHVSGNNLTVCWNPGDPGSHVDKVQIQIRRKPNQPPGCVFDVRNKLANPADAPNNCALVQFNIANCDCIYQSRARYRCIDGEFSPWKFDNIITPNCGLVRLAGDSEFEPFRIYPNPATDILHLDYVPWETGEIKVTLFNILGKKEIERRFEVQEGDNHFRIDVAKLATGTYLVEIREGEEVRKTKIIVGR